MSRAIETARLNLRNEKVVILDGQDIAQACWDFAQQNNKIPECIQEDRHLYRGIMLVKFPPDAERTGGSFENIQFAVKRDVVDIEVPPNSLKEEI